MFVFLSKKLALPGGVRLRCVAWHAAGEWVACGGENGLLKVYRFRSEGRVDGADDDDDNDRDDASSSSAQQPLHHQTLEGHASAVVLADFCEPVGKLATADRSGLVMVWSLRSQASQGGRGGGGDSQMLWEEEAVHRAMAAAPQPHPITPPSSSSTSSKKNKGQAPAPLPLPPRVTALRWSPSGERLALAYSDGSALVASVDGHRLWHSRVTAGSPLERVCWRPDGRVLLAASAEGHVTAHDALSGERQQLQGGGGGGADDDASLGRITLHCCNQENPVAPPVRIAALEWHWSRMLGVGAATAAAAAGGGNGNGSGVASVTSPAQPLGNRRRALLIVCSNGLLQLMRSEAEEDDADDDADDGATVVCVDTGLAAPLCASWAPDGATFAVSGLAPPPSASCSSSPSSSARVIPTIQLYTSAGEHLHTFRVDGGGGGGGSSAAAAATKAAAATVMPVEGLAWEGAGPQRSRLSLAVGPSLLLANVRRPHLWARFGGDGGGDGGDGGGGVIAFAAAAAAGGDGQGGDARGSEQAQRLVIADAGALLAALDCDRRRYRRPHANSSSSPSAARLPRPRVFVKGVPCSRSDGSSAHAAAIVNMASAGDLCALACAVAGGGGGGASGRCRLVLVDAAGEAFATQALPPGASARFFAAARWNGSRDGDQDEVADVFGGGGKEDYQDDDDDHNDGAAAAVVAAAGEDGGGVFVWWWRRRQTQAREDKPADCCWGFHVDHLPLGPLAQPSSSVSSHPQRPPLSSSSSSSSCSSSSLAAALAAPVQDHITAIALNRTGTRLLIGRESGVVADYSLGWAPPLRGGREGAAAAAGSSRTRRAPPHQPSASVVIELRARHLLRCCPSRLEFNSDCSLVAVIDTSGDLTLLALAPPPPPAHLPPPSLAGPFAAVAAVAAPPSASSPAATSSSSSCGPPGKHLAAVRHEVWDVCWSSDEPFKLAAMEREHLRVLHCPALEPEADGRGAGERGAAAADDDDQDDRRRRLCAQECRWRRGMPHLLEYGSLRVVGLALDALVAAGAGAGAGGGGGSSIAVAAADLLASGRAVFLHETQVLRRAREMVALRSPREARRGTGRAGSTGSTGSIGSSSSSRLAAELAALWSTTTTTATGKQNQQQDLLHPRLSRLLADHALACGDWATAERALRACGDYGGVLLARKGALLQRQEEQVGAARGLAAAEAALVRREFAAAERAYCRADRADLAVAMWQRLGRERLAEQLLLLPQGVTTGGVGMMSSGSSGRSSLAPASTELTACWHRQARAAAERRRWSRAGRQLALCLDSGTGAGAVAAERDAVRWLHLSGGDGDGGGSSGGGSAAAAWERLARMATSTDRGLPDGSPLLAVLSARLRSAGLAEAAAAAVERGSGC